MTREQFGLSLAQSLYAAYLSTRAQVDAVRYGPGSRNPERVETHFNGVNTVLFRPDPEARAQARLQLGFADDTLVFSSVAVLRKGKGLEHLLEAVLVVRQQVPRARFLVVGDGEERARLEARSTALGVDDVVRFLGARTDVPRLLSATDVFVHPSLYEALPTSVLEAMAAGLPVVATDVGGIPELVSVERTGLLVPPGDIPCSS